MKSVVLLALAAVATCSPQVHLPHKPGTPYPSLNYRCFEDMPQPQNCNIDETMTECKDGVGTVYNCVGGCQIYCPVDDCYSICKDPYNGDTWKYVDDGNFFHEG